MVVVYLENEEKNKMKFTVQNIYDFYSPSLCERRLFYRFIGEEETPPGPFEEVIFMLGQRHEKNYVNSLGEYIDVSKVSRGQQPEKTKELIQNNTPVIYQGVLAGNEIINGSQVQIIGVPDIMIRENSSYIIRDCKLARHADEKKHPEILSYKYMDTCMKESLERNLSNLKYS